MDDPNDESALMSDFAADIDAFERTFPPLCENCKPLVDDVIRQKDYRAQVAAWSLALSRKQNDRDQEHDATTAAAKGAIYNANEHREMIIWAGRGGLFAVSAVVELCNKLFREVESPFSIRHTS